MISVMELYSADGLEARRASGRELQGPCPGCGGRDRFCIYLDQKNGAGTYHCGHGKLGNGCHKGGDSVQYMMDFHGLSFAEAAAHVGKVLEQRPPSYKRLVPNPSANTSGKNTMAHKIVTWSWRKEVVNTGAWMTAAEKFVDRCHLALMQSEKALHWLQARGVDMGMAAKYQLGLNKGRTGNGAVRQPDYRPWVSWGLPDKKNRNGRPMVLALPAGIVIPWFDSSGRAVRVRIRASNPRPQDPKYHVVKGSRLDTWISSHGRAVYIVVETELDAAMLDAVSGHICGQVALGSVGIGPDTATDRSLRNAALILNCLDNDDAGRKASEWWEKTYRNCVRVLPPGGAKDPGNAYEDGHDLCEWIYDALPRGLQYRYRSRLQDAAVSRGTTCISGRGDLQGEWGKKTEQGVEKTETVISTFIRELRRVGGVVVVSDRGRALGVKFKAMSTPETLLVRRKVTSALYQNRDIAAFVGLLDDGIWTPQSLASFYGV